MKLTTNDYPNPITNRTKLNVRTSTRCNRFIKPFNQQYTWQLEVKENLTVLNNFNIRCLKEFHEESIYCKTRNTFGGTWYLPHSRVHKSMAELCSNFGDSAITKGQIAYFSLRVRETLIFLLPVKNRTSPSCSPTPISYKM